MENLTIQTNGICTKQNQLERVRRIWIFAKNETVIQIIRIYCKDFGMEFGIGKGAVLIMKNWKRETADRIEVQNQEIIKTLGENQNSKHLGILEADCIK